MSNSENETIPDLGIPEVKRPIRRSITRLGASVCAAACLLGGNPAKTEAVNAGCWRGTGYDYAGIADGDKFDAFKATITETASPRIVNGHVAAWIGFGAEGVGPGGTDEWLQAGIERGADDTEDEIYYEIELPHKQVSRAYLGQVALNTPVALQFTEVSTKPERWVLTVDGRRGPIFTMASGHETWRPGFISESYIQEKTGCNIFHYDFQDIAIRRPRSEVWRAPIKIKKVTQPPSGYTVRNLTKNSFTTTAITPNSNS